MDFKKIAKALFATVALATIPVLGLGSTAVYAQTDYDYDYDYDTTYDYEYETTGEELTDDQMAAMIAFMTTFGACFAVIGFVYYIITALAMKKAGDKLGMENTWMAFVPLLNFYYLTLLAGLESWKVLLVFFIPFYITYVFYKVAERSGLPGWYGLLTLVIPFDLIFWYKLGWGKQERGQAPTSTSTVTTTPTAA